MKTNGNMIKNDFMPLLKLAVPMVLTGVVQSSLSFFQNIFLSRLGEHVLAAGGLVSWLFATLVVIVFGTFGAVNILIAHKYGANDKAGIVLVLRDGLLLATLLTIPTFILFWNISPVLFLFGQSSKLVDLSKLYLHALAWGLFPKFILIILYELLIGLGHARVIMVVTILTIPVYILFGFVLIFGKFGFPALGIAGAGWGMTFADWIIAFIFGFLLFYSKEYRPYVRAIFTVKKPSYLWEIIHVGIPIGAMYSMEVAFFLAVTLVMGTIGVQQLAANQVAMQYLCPLMGVIFSMAQAVTVRMGHQLGAKQFDAVKKTAFTGVFLSVVFMSIVAVIYWIVPRLLISVDFNLKNPSYAETIRFAVDFLFIAAFFQILECIRISLFGALRAFKDTHFTFFASIIGFWCVSLPLGYLLATRFKLGGEGLWWAMVVGAACNMSLLFWRFNLKIKKMGSYRDPIP